MGLVGCSSLALLGRANAAPFTTAYVRLTTMKAGAVTGGRVCAKTSTVATEGKVLLTIPVMSPVFTIGAAANFIADTSNLEASQTAWPNMAGVTPTLAGNTLTYTPGTAPDITAGTLYCFNFGAGLTNPTAGATTTTSGSVATQTAAAAAIDSTNWATSIISDDAIVVTGTVPPSFSFALNGNTDTFATNLATGTVNTSNGNRQVTITTNAASGWIVWVKSLTANAVTGKGSLASATANYKITGSVAIGASHLFSSGTEDYGLAVTTTKGSGAITPTNDANYNGTTTDFAGTLDPTNFRPVASSTGPATSDLINLKEKVVITGATPAASDYTDTLQVIGAGVF